MSLNNPAWIANGTIQPSRFVKIDTTAGKVKNVLQAAAATDKLIGISQDGSRDAPGTTGAATDAARAGHTLHVFGLGDTCLLELGTGGATAGGDLRVQDSVRSGVDDRTHARDDSPQAVRHGGGWPSSARSPGTSCHGVRDSSG